MNDEKILNEEESQVEEAPVKEEKVSKKEAKKDFKELEKTYEKTLLEYDKLKKEYDVVKGNLDKYANSMSHYANLAKGYQRDYEILKKYRSQDIVEKLIPSLDAFNFAFQNEAPESARNYLIGFQYVQQTILTILADEGVKMIEPKENDTFDPNLHQAVQSVETDELKLVNKIQKVLTKGYQLYDRLIKSAGVIVYVAKKIEEKNKEE
jgi:molecular chaperone GrpE